ncbi:MAG: hypothetical protein HYV41_04620 [Candidatus Magasanikbacteria bacterium]|nr:hypothetical protein [Candidatus Magasanikbacteria bacterium]
MSFLFFGRTEILFCQFDTLVAGLSCDDAKVYSISKDGVDNLPYEFQGIFPSLKNQYDKRPVLDANGSAALVDEPVWRELFAPHFFLLLPPWVKSICTIACLGFVVNIFEES